MYQIGGPCNRAHQNPKESNSGPEQETKGSTLDYSRVDGPGYAQATLRIPQPAEAGMPNRSKRLTMQNLGNPRVHIHAHLSNCSNIQMYMSKYKCTDAYICTYVHTYLYVYTYRYVNICVDKCVYIHKECVYIYTYRRYARYLY